MFIHGRVMLAMEEKSVLPMSISPFGTKEEVQLKVPKQGLDKIGVGMDRCSPAIGYIPSSSTFWFNAFLSRRTHHTKSCRIGRNWYWSYIPVTLRVTVNPLL